MGSRHKTVPTNLWLENRATFSGYPYIFSLSSTRPAWRCACMCVCLCVCGSLTSRPDHLQARWIQTHATTVGVYFRHIVARCRLKHHKSVSLERHQRVTLSLHGHSLTTRVTGQTRSKANEEEMRFPYWIILCQINKWIPHHRRRIGLFLYVEACIKKWEIYPRKCRKES